MNIERRFVALDDHEDTSKPLQVERRAAPDGGKESVYLVGYAAMFGVNSVVLDDFVERIDPNAFRVVSERRGRKRPLETRALYNHDPNHVLGRFPNTLKLSVDDVGLRYEVELPKSREDLAELVERGDIRGSSFSFTIARGGESWSEEDGGRRVRTVTKVEELYDVGPVAFPAYPSTEGLDVARRSLDQWIKAQKSKSDAEIERLEARRMWVEEMQNRLSNHREVLEKYGSSKAR